MLEGNLHVLRGFEACCLTQFWINQCCVALRCRLHFNLQQEGGDGVEESGRKRGAKKSEGERRRMEEGEKALEA